MTTPETARFRIERYRPAYRQAIRDICVATAWMGECPEGFLADDWLWSEYWTRYFTDRRPDYTWVVIDSDDGSVVGT